MTHAHLVCFHRCIDVAGAYSAQKTELNISLTAVGLLWTSTDFIVKGLMHGTEDAETGLASALYNWRFLVVPWQVIEIGLFPCILFLGNYHFILIPDERNSEKGEEQTLDSDNEVNNHTSLLNILDGDKLLLSIFALLQKLVADERPEVQFFFVHWRLVCQRFL